MSDTREERFQEFFDQLDWTQQLEVLEAAWQYMKNMADDDHFETETDIDFQETWQELDSFMNPEE